MGAAMMTRLIVEFTKAGADVTELIMPDLISFSYTDNESEEADEISLSLKDPTGKWAGTWKPKGGEVIRAYIQQGTVTHEGKKLYCGKFYADSLSASGNPRTVSIKGVAIPLNKPIRKKVKSKAWEAVNLKDVANAIGASAEMKVSFDVEDDSVPTYDRVEQKRESDLKFLIRLCEEAGYSLKVTNDKIYIFDQYSYEKKKPIKTFELGVADILDWSFESAQSETYKSVSISFRDPDLKKEKEAAGFSTDETLEKDESGDNKAVWNYTYTDPEADEDGQEFGYKSRCKSLNEARRKAKAKLRELNKRGITGSMSVVGDVNLCAGAVIECKGFGSFDGNFIVEKADHSYSTSGYVTKIDLRRVNTRY